MNVKELKKLLETVDDDLIVILQKDGEGNGYSPCAGIDDEMNYEPESTYSGTVGYRKLTPELIEKGYSEEDCLPHAQPALIFYPIN